MSCANNSQTCNEQLPCCDTTNFYCYEDTVCVDRNYLVVDISNYVIIIFVFLLVVMFSAVVYAFTTYRKRKDYTPLDDEV